MARRGAPSPLHEEGRPPTASDGGRPVDGMGGSSSGDSVATLDDIRMHRRRYRWHKFSLDQHGCDCASDFVAIVDELWPAPVVP